MREFAVVFILGMFVSLGACGGNMNQYKTSNIEILSVQRLPSGKTEILYQPMLESMYYCPGASIRQDAGRHKVSFVRCSIKEKCSVDAIAEKSDQGKLKIVLPSAPESIDLVFIDGEIRLPK